MTIVYTDKNGFVKKSSKKFKEVYTVFFNYSHDLRKISIERYEQKDFYHIDDAIDFLKNQK